VIWMSWWEVALKSITSVKNWSRWPCSSISECLNAGTFDSPFPQAVQTRRVSSCQHRVPNGCSLQSRNRHDFPFYR
jgi:hypothetical protein